MRGPDALSGAVHKPRTTPMTDVFYERWRGIYFFCLLSSSRLRLCLATTTGLSDLLGRSTATGFGFGRLTDGENGPRAGRAALVCCLDCYSIRLLMYVFIHG